MGNSSRHNGLGPLSIATPSTAAGDWSTRRMISIPSEAARWINAFPVARCTRCGIMSGAALPKVRLAAMQHSVSEMANKRLAHRKNLSAGRTFCLGSLLAVRRYDFIQSCYWDRAEGPAGRIGSVGADGRQNTENQATLVLWVPTTPAYVRAP
jgi:hypothetical protein